MLFNWLSSNFYNFFRRYTACPVIFPHYSTDSALFEGTGSSDRVPLRIPLHGIFNKNYMKKLQTAVSNKRVRRGKDMIGR